MFKLPYRSSCRPYIRQNGILTIYSMYMYQALCYVKRNLDTFVKCGDVNKYATRVSDNLYVPFSRLNLF